MKRHHGNSASWEQGIAVGAAVSLIAVTLVLGQGRQGDPAAMDERSLQAREAAQFELELLQLRRLAMDAGDPEQYVRSAEQWAESNRSRVDAHNARVAALDASDASRRALAEANGNAENEDANADGRAADSGKPESAQDDAIDREIRDIERTLEKLHRSFFSQAQSEEELFAAQDAIDDWQREHPEYSAMMERMEELGKQKFEREWYEAPLQPIEFDVPADATAEELAAADLQEELAAKYLSLRADSRALSPIEFQDLLADNEAYFQLRHEKLRDLAPATVRAGVDRAIAHLERELELGVASQTGEKPGQPE